MSTDVPELSAGPAVQPSPAAPAYDGPAPPAEQWRPVDTAKLVTGRRLRHPIRDQAGLLLLSAGSTITERFKELLVARGIREVLLHEFDALDRASVPGLQSVPVVEQIDPQLAAGLDERVESGRLFAADAGPKFKD